MARIVVVRPGPGSPEMLTLEAWQALASHPVWTAPGDPLGARLRDAGYRVHDLDEADPARLRSADARATNGLRGTNLLAPHTHGEVNEGARALAGRLATLAAEHEAIAFVTDDETAVRAIVARAFESDVEVEMVMGVLPRGHALLDVVRVMARLRGPGGCPWDAEQTHQTLAKHLLDETYELLEAIERGTPLDIAEELGDLLLQVVFHAQMGADAGVFDVDVLARGLVDKLVRRHPHVFADVEVSGAAEVVANWDTIKEGEKKRGTAVEGIPESLPALAYAQKIQRRAGAAGFDWDDVEGALAKVREEAEELARATDEATRESELGDLLFAIVALGRHVGVDAETALRRSSHRFRERFMEVERAARARGLTLAELGEAELVDLWRAAKGGA